MRIVEAIQSSGSQGNLAALKSIAAGKPITIADAGRIYGRGVMCPRLVGTAKDVADEMAEIVTVRRGRRLCGFAGVPARYVRGFRRGVVPILQEKGLFRREYEGRTCAIISGIAASRREGDASARQ